MSERLSAEDIEHVRKHSNVTGEFAYDLNRWVPRLLDHIDALEQDLRSAERDLKTARETLEWYGGSEAWTFHRIPGTYSSTYREIEHDKGERARLALAALDTERPQTMTYQIETRYEGQWIPVEDADLNKFDTIAEAEEAIEQLRQIGSGWANAEYRIVERATP